MSPQYMYRIEHKVTGEGPYHDNLTICHGKYCTLSKHPSVWLDVKEIEPDYRFYCAFKTIELFMNWFNYDYLLAIIDTEEYQLTIWDVSMCDYGHGEKQSVFDKANAVLVDTMELSNLLPFYERSQE